MSRIRYSDEVKRQAVSLVVDDLLSIAEAARQTGCSAFTLSNWIKKYHRSGDPGMEPRSKSAFVPVSIIDAPTAPVEIVTPNGYTVRLAAASPQYLIELLTAIASC